MSNFKEIIGYPNYLIFEDGKVYSKKTKRYLKEAFSSSGYLQVCLCNNGNCKFQFIHRLVAIHFIENPLNKRTVNHIDGKKTNNHLSNLEWATYSENQSHAIKIGLNKKPPTYKGKFGKDHNKSIKIIDQNGILYHGLSDAARIIGLKISHISYLLRKKKVSKNGYSFTYA